MDDGIAFIDLASAQDLLDLGDEVTRIVLAGSKTEEVKKAASSFVLGNKTLAAFGWEEFAKATVSGVRTDTDSFYFVAVILFGLIIVGILNSMSMSVHERHRELAALRAVGFRSRDVRGLILLESAVLAALGTAVGFIVLHPWLLGSASQGWICPRTYPRISPYPSGKYITRTIGFGSFCLARPSASDPAL